MQINIDTAHERAKIESEISSLQNRLAAIDLIEQGFVGSPSNGNGGGRSYHSKNQKMKEYLPKITAYLESNPGASKKEICTIVYGRASKKNFHKFKYLIRSYRSKFSCKGHGASACWYLADQPC